MVALNQPAAWIFELLLAEVFKQIGILQEDKENYDPQIQDERSGTFLGTCSKSLIEDVPESIPKMAVDVNTLTHAQDEDNLNRLKEKVKLNIENC